MVLQTAGKDDIILHHYLVHSSHHVPMSIYENYNEMTDCWVAADGNK